MVFQHTATLWIIIIDQVKEEATNWRTMERNLSFVWSDNFCVLNSLFKGRAFALFQENETESIASLKKAAPELTSFVTSFV
jgi:hypothetical protein